jgi:hypothetical protein
MAAAPRPVARLAVACAWHAGAAGGRARKAHDRGMNASRAAARRYLPSSPFKAPAPVLPAETFAVHDQVTHDKYGLGVILAVEDHAVLVDFRPDERRIPLPCTKLTKL